jgi:hypothetical protein
MRDQARRPMSNPLSSKRKIGIVILALPILLLLILGLVEFVLIFAAWIMVENSARTAARYAVTGQFNPTYCSQFASFTADPKASASCDLRLNRDELGHEYWVPDAGETPAGLCARIFGGRSLPAVCEHNTDMTFEDVVGAMQDAARLDSIRDIAIRGAPSLLMDRATSDPTARGWFHTEICSSRRYMNPDPPNSSTYRPAYAWNAPDCFRLNYDGSHRGHENDAGGPGDQIIINVLFNHPLITPIRGVSGNVDNWIRLNAVRTMVVERFRTSRVYGLPPLVALFTPTPTSEPQITQTPIPNAIIEAEWPTRMEMGRSDSIRVSLIRAEGHTFIPTVEKIGHIAIAATPIPAGTPEAPLEKAFGQEYEACATANLVGAAFEIRAVATECRSVDQPKVTWEWNIIPRESGTQVVNVSLDVQWKPIKGDRPIKEYQLWRSRIDIVVDKPLVPANVLNVINWGGGFAGLMLTAPWLYEETRKRRSARPRMSNQSHVLFNHLREHFSLEELRTLCFDLDVDYESLPGEGKEAKARELVLYQQRLEKLDQLAEAIRRVRGNVV